jgi:hypothetical protein
MGLTNRVETLVTSQVDGATLTAAAAASMIPAAAKFTLRPNYFDVIGKALRIRAHGRISCAITTPGTARFDVRFGGTVVFDSLAIALATPEAYTDKPWFLEVLLTCRAIGATGNLMGVGIWISHNIVGAPATMPKGALSAPLPWNAAPAVGGNFDTTASQQVDVQFTQTVATGSLICHQYMLESLN